VNTTGYGGSAVEKQITVRTDDRKNPVVYLYVAGEVEKFARVEPEQIALNGPLGEDLSASVTLSPIKDRRFRIVESQATNGKNIRYVLEPISADGQGGYRLTVHNTQQSKGRYFDTIVLKTDHPTVREMRLRVTGNIY